MNNHRLIIFTVILYLTGFGSINVGAEIIAFWSFNNGFDVKNGASQIVHDSDVGNAVLYQQRADTDGNGKSGNSYTLEGESIPPGKAMAWDDVAKSGDNDAEFFITVSTKGYSNIKISMDIGGNSDDGIVSFDMKYSFDPLQDAVIEDVDGIIKDFNNGISIDHLNDWPANPLPGYRRKVLDFKGGKIPLIPDQADPLELLAIEDKELVVIRFDDWEDNDALRIDNVLIEGTNTSLPLIPIEVQNESQNGKQIITLKWPSKVGHNYKVSNSENLNVWNDDVLSIDGSSSLVGTGELLTLSFESIQRINYFKIQEYVQESE